MNELAEDVFPVSHFSLVQQLAEKRGTRVGVVREQKGKEEDERGTCYICLSSPASCTVSLCLVIDRCQLAYTLCAQVHAGTRQAMYTLLHASCSDQDREEEVERQFFYYTHSWVRDRHIHIFGT